MRKAPSLPKGFRDFLPEEARLRRAIINHLVAVFKRFGFQPLETPTVEYAKTLLSKYGQEAERLIYIFEDRGGRQLGLRYDLTVPTARVLATQRYQIKLPFARWQVQNVFRAEKPQRGRWREFTQCDIDIFGSHSPLADALILAVVWEGYSNLGIRDFRILINSRQILKQILKQAGISPLLANPILQSLDKLEKIGRESVENELAQKGLSTNTIQQLFAALKKSRPNQNLKEIIRLTQKLGVPKEVLCFTPFLVRGLDYYTGAIFETVVSKPALGSIGGGGRYDKLIAQLGGPNIPAVGYSFGIDRICEVVKNQKLGEFQRPKGILIVVASPEMVEFAILVLRTLHQAGFPTEIYLEPAAKLRRQLKYANQRNFSWVIIVGPKEATKKQVVVRNFVTGEQKTISLSKLPSYLERRTSSGSGNAAVEESF